MRKCTVTAAAVSCFVFLCTAQQNGGGRMVMSIGDIFAIADSASSSFIRKIYFEEYRPVKAGDTLLVIEDAEFRLRLALARADLANASAGRAAAAVSVATMQNNLSVSDAAIEEVRVRMENCAKELARYEVLLGQEAVSDATGAAFSILPQDNATGNFVKVEQRVPVRIALEGNAPEHLDLLRAGFNVECRVKY